jgi:outer membrane receptor protein involved in Fe transport
VRGSVRFRRRGGEELSYDALDGTTTADGQDALTAGLTATYDRLFVQMRASQRERELPGAPFGASYGSADNLDRDRLLVGELGYTRSLGKRADVISRLYASAYELDGVLAYDDGSTLATHGASRWYGGELRLQADGRALMPRGGRLDLTTGLAFESAATTADSVRSGQGAPPPIEQDLSILGAYGEATAQPVPWAALTAGVRFDRNSLFESKLNPRLALLLFAGERFGAKALYAEGFRNPSAFEAFFEDDRFKPAGTALFPESIRSFEGVLWARPRRGLKLRASAWRWDLLALIERRGVVDPMTLTERLQYQNLAALRSLGVEVEASYRDTTGWFAFAGGAWAQVRRNVIETPPNAPELTAAGGISTPSLFGHVHVSAQGTYLGSRLTRDEEIEAAPWLGLDVTLFAPSIRGFDLSVGARNLIGTRVEVVAQDDYDRPSQGSLGEPPTEVLIVPGTGRELFVRLGYAL